MLQQQQGQQLAVAVEALPPAPPLLHLQPDQDEQQQLMIKPQLPQLDIEQLEPCCGQEELVWTPERLNVLLLNSDNGHPDDGTATVVEAVAPPAAADAAAADDETCSDGDAPTCTACVGQAPIATSKQVAELEKQMLPLLTHEGTAADRAAAAAAAAGVQGITLESAGDERSTAAGAAGSSHASTAATAAAAAAVDEGVQLTEPDDEQAEEALVQQQQSRRCQRQQQAAGKVANQRLPAKDAQPGDYLKVEPNSRWSALAFEAAAAAGAARLGVPAAVVPPLPSAQQRDQTEQQGSQHVSDQTASASAGAAAADASTSAASAAPPAAEASAAAATEGQLPDVACSAEFGVLMLAHDVGVTHAAAWQAWEAAHDGRVVVLVHLKAGVTLSASAAGADWLASGRQLRTRVASEWGDISLTQAVLSSAAEMLQRCPRLQHIAVVSGQDVPVAALQLPLPPGASLIGFFQFGREYDAAARLVAAATLQQQLGMGKAEAGAWGDLLTFHHTWLTLSR
jgi:hypothetical protein